MKEGPLKAGPFWVAGDWWLGIAREACHSLDCE